METTYGTAALKSRAEVFSNLAHSEYLSDAPENLHDAIPSKIAPAWYADAAPDEAGRSLIYPVYVLRGEGTAESGEKASFTVLVDAVE